MALPHGFGRFAQRLRPMATPAQLEEEAKRLFEGVCCGSRTKWARIHLHPGPQKPHCRERALPLSVAPGCRQPRWPHGRLTAAHPDNTHPPIGEDSSNRSTASKITSSASSNALLKSSEWFLSPRPTRLENSRINGSREFIISTSIEPRESLRRGPLCEELSPNSPGSPRKPLKPRMAIPCISFSPILSSFQCTVVRSALIGCAAD